MSVSRICRLCSAVDRAGLVGSDGETHQGIFDLTFLSSVPNMSVMAPKNRWELEKMLQFAIYYDGPIAIRYPRGEAYRGLKEFLAPVEYGVSEMLYEERGMALLAVGSMVSTAEHIREKLKSAGQPCTLVNGRFVKPMDTDVHRPSGRNAPYDRDTGGKCPARRLTASG